MNGPLAALLFVGLFSLLTVAFIVGENGCATVQKAEQEGEQILIADSVCITKAVVNGKDPATVCLPGVDPTSYRYVQINKTCAALKAQDAGGQ